MSLNTALKLLKPCSSAGQVEAAGGGNQPSVHQPTPQQEAGHFPTKYVVFAKL
jgi:hypothetical protein